MTAELEDASGYTNQTGDTDRKILFSTLISPNVVYGITHEHLLQFTGLSNIVANVESQLKIIAWNRAGPEIQSQRNLGSVELTWVTDGVLVTLYAKGGG